MYFPKLKRLKSNLDFENYGTTYFKCSGLPVPEDYLKNHDNRVYSITIKDRMVGGYILATGEELRTLEVFAQPSGREKLYTQIGQPRNFTEICCFWIDPDYRRNTKVNLFVWLCLAFTLKFHSAKNILFGTCSSSLAKLYGVTPKSVLIHQDKVHEKRTFIFQSERRTCLTGFYEIIMHKLKRTRVIKRQFAERMAKAA